MLWSGLTFLNFMDFTSFSSRERRIGAVKPKPSPHMFSIKCVFYGTEEVRAGQEFPEMLQSYPFAAGKAQKRLIVLEGNQYAPHGSVTEYEIPDKDRKDQKIGKIVFPEVPFPYSSG